MMTIKVLALSILQGVAEFLPISSSGHLVLGKELLGMEELGMRLDIFLHVGTLLAVFLFYRAVILRILAQREWSYVGKIVMSAVPAGLVGVACKDQLEALFASPTAVGCALMFTGVVLTLTRWLPRGEREVSTRGALAMGVAQAVAIAPGISRSGMTLAAARALKVEPAKAAEFSFLMSAPPIMGAALLDVMKAFKAPATAAAEVSWPLTLLGAAVAAVVGYAALALLVRSLRGRWFWLFGPYCLAVGFLTVLLTWGR